MKSEHQGLKRILFAFGNSLAGLRSAWQFEAAFRQEVVLFVIMSIAAFGLGETAFEVLLLIGVWLWVLIVELLNSAVEAVVDRVGSEYHELSGRAKDQASAAVLLSILFATAVWVVVIVKHW